MSSNLPYKQAANVERRTWDKAAYEARAKARIAAEKQDGSSDKRKSSSLPLNDDDNSPNTNKITLEDVAEKEEFQKAESGAQGPLNSKRAFLKARRGKVDLESKVGTSEIINPDAVATSSASSDGVSIKDGVTKSVNGVGWHCKVCDCFLKDSLAYLDHINGRKHQRALGFSMRIARSTTSEVASKLQELAKEKESKELEALSDLGNDESNEYEFEDMVKKKDEEIEKRRAERKKRRKERKKKAKQEEINTPKVEDSSPEETGKEEDGEQEVEDDEGEPDIAAMMGFSGFGSTK